MSEITEIQEIPTKGEIRTSQPRKSLSRRSLKKQLNEAREHATHDPLTGLLNRAGFNELFEREISRIKRSLFDSETHHRPARKESKAVIFYFDLNEFKQVNESLGHAGGDEKLKEVAKILSGKTRPTDIVARMGGDEFVMVLSGNDLESVKNYWETDLLPALNAGGISISAGVAEVNPQSSIDENVKLADTIQTKAKTISRGNGHSTQVVFRET